MIHYDTNIYITGILLNKMLCSQRTHKSTTSVTNPYHIASVRDEHTFCLTLIMIILLLSVTGPNLKPVPEGMDGNALDPCSCITCFAPIQWYELTTYYHRNVV